MSHPRPPFRSVVFLSFSLATLAALAACDDGAEPTGTGGGGSGTGAGNTGGSTGSGSSAGLPCDVADILAANCQECHSDPPKYGAPMPLVDRDDLLAAPTGKGKDSGLSLAELIAQRVDSAAEPMPPPPGMLSAGDKATLLAYLDAGLPESSENCGSGGGGAGGSMPTSCTPDVQLKPAAPYTMPQNSVDEYVCFGVEAPDGEERHITAIAPLIDNETILHHILLLQSPDPVSAQGEPCGFTNADWKLIYAWGPGTGALEMPPEAGYPIGPSEPGHFVIQVHYNNVAMLAGQSDQSGVQLCTTTEKRQYDADIMAFGGLNFDPIPPGQEKTLECTTPIPSLVDAYFPVTLFQAWPHMHQIGRQLRSVRVRGGQETMLADVPNYDFEYQIGYPIDVQLDVGDSIKTSCTWQNSTNQSVGFGEGSQDEMCFNFVSFYPRITAPQWSWLAPSAGASCTWTQ